VNGIFNDDFLSFRKGRVQILEDRSLKLDNITMDDVGEYSCEADNAVGSIVASGMLLVHCKSPKSCQR
jgi:hypothetical protein